MKRQRTSSSAFSSGGVRLALRSKSNATAPATIGAAIDVPLFTTVAPSLALDALVMSSPAPCVDRRASPSAETMNRAGENHPDHAVGRELRGVLSYLERAW
jgi:hypothetical protein